MRRPFRPAPYLPYREAPFAGRLPGSGRAKAGRRRVNAKNENNWSCPDLVDR